MAQEVENKYLGIPSGTLDQQIIVNSGIDVMRSIDFATMETREYSVPTIPGWKLAVLDTDEARNLGPGNIGERRVECAEAMVSAFGSNGRDAWSSLFKADRLDAVALQKLPEKSRRRIHHVWSESKRVQVLIDALKTSDVGLICDVINSSHASMRDDFDVSTDRVESVRAELLALPDVRAARLIGAGFGGCLLVFARGAARLPHVNFLI